MANVYEVWLRKWNGNVWSEITSYVQINTLEFTDTIDGEPFTFGFNIHDRLKNSDTVTSIDDGDYIVVINPTTGEVAENGKMLGRVDLDANLVGADWANKSTKPFRFENDIIVKELDFSDNKLRFFPDENSAAALKGYVDTNLSTILDDIFLYTTELLGGTINNETIPKYNFSDNFDDYVVKSYKAEYKSSREAFVELTEQERLFFKVRWKYQTDATYGLRVAGTVVVYDRGGLAPFHPSWEELDVNGQSGVTDELIRVGKVSNTGFGSNPLEPRFFYCCKNIDLNTDKDIIRNYILLEATIVENADAFNNDDNALSRYTERVEHAKQFNYTLPFPALDIKYVGFLARTNITNETTPATTAFSIPSFQSALFNYNALSGRGDTVRVFDRSGNVQGFREITNVSGNTITIDEALSFTPAVDDIVENVQPYWLTIFEDREEDNNSFGVVKEINRDKTNQEAKIRFLDLSEPPPGVTIVIYYYKCFKYKDTPYNQASIDRYGLRKYEVKLNGIFTKAQIKDIGQRLLITEPNKTIDMVEYRPIEAGTQVPVNITGFIDQTTLKASQVRGRFIGKKEQNFVYTEYDVTLSELKEDIEDIVRRINNQYKSDRSSGDDHNRIIQEETIHVITEINKQTTTYTTNVIFFSSDRAIAGVDVSSNYKIFYMTDTGANPTYLLAGTGGNEFNLRINQAGTKAVWESDRHGNYQLYIADITNNGTTIALTNVTRLTNNVANDRYPTFLNNGLICYSKAGNLYTIEDDGTNETLIVNEANNVQFPFSLYNSNTIIAQVAAPSDDIVSYNYSGGGRSTILNDTNPPRSPSASDDDSIIIYSYDTGGFRRLYSVPTVTSPTPTTGTLRLAVSGDINSPKFKPNSTDTCTFAANIGGGGATNQIYTFTFGSSETNISNNAYNDITPYWTSILIT